MKKINSLLLTAIFTILACLTAAASGTDKSDDLPFTIDAKSFDFGTITQSAQNVVHDFIITNDSEDPIVIRSAVASCGCTRPKFTTKPILPGESGIVSVTFIPKGQKGYISKDIKVVVYHKKKKKRVTLQITGDVTPE